MKYLAEHTSAGATGSTALTAHWRAATPETSLEPPSLPPASNIGRAQSSGRSASRLGGAAGERRCGAFL
eukprot:CAMPEP_0172198700 /NCGR_PEP_ID=MMETSP1050-20130122/28246_1 /TAXON_ID=233186 /ORGANISM="Cryptomonas curvata, Strain CCAP979/52" /LENGTH=68 /DNA_ID=CAMNT_0012875577 /DNA_START=345 /DNA_END=548 /DNA_ORIENTATION=-